jgi:hypothetical protein
MRAFLISTLLVTSACAVLPKRLPASAGPWVVGDVSGEYSQLQKYPSDVEQVFYLELRSSEKKLVDADTKDFELSYLGKPLEFKLQRLSQGKYTLEPTSHFEDVSKATFIVQNKLIKNTLIALKKPTRKSQIQLLSSNGHELKLKLMLKDKEGKPVVSGQYPDIILDGLGEVSELESQGPGIWIFKVKYPEENQVFYLSVRIHGILLEKLFRYQYVEK